VIHVPSNFSYSLQVDNLFIIQLAPSICKYPSSCGMNGEVNPLTTFSSMYGVMGIANAQRTLTYLQIITEFVSQDQYRDVVGMSVSPLFSEEKVFTCP